MSKPLILAFSHDLGANEVRRRLDRRTDWLFRKVQELKVDLNLRDWDGTSRAFTAKALGQDVTGFVAVSDDSLRIEALLPFGLRLLGPAIEAVLKTYVGRLLAPAGG